MTNAIPLFKVGLDPDAALAALEPVLRSGYIGQGSKVEEFEAALRVALQAPRDVLTVNSCTSAIDLALHLCGVGPGTSVVTTPMTCAATNVHIVNRGAVPIWADIDPITGLIDPVDVARKVRPDTRAIIAVDWAGRVCDYEEFPYGVPPIIEDAAHAYLARRDGYPIAQGCADYIAWSFQAIKHLTSGDGGALLCPDDETTERARLLRWYGLDRRSKADFRADQDIDECGYKYHMNDISAAIGLSNMRDAEFAVMASRHCAGSLTFALEGCPGITLPPPDPGMSWWLYTILCDDPRDLSQHLAKDGIISSGVHKRNDLHPAFIRAAGETKPGDLPGVDYFASHELAIPCGSWVSDEDVARIACSIRQWAENRDKVAG